MSWLRSMDAQTLVLCPKQPLKLLGCRSSGMALQAFQKPYLIFRGSGTPHPRVRACTRQQGSCQSLEICSIVRQRNAKQPGTGISQVRPKEVGVFEGLRLTVHLATVI